MASADRLDASISTLGTSAAMESPRDTWGWGALPRAAQLYVVSVIAVGTYFVVAFFPLTYPHPFLFVLLLAFSCLTSVWKVNLISPAIGATLSVSYAANLMALLLVGSPAAMVVAVAGAWTQCTFKVKERNPAYRTAFSMAAEAITIQATGLAYFWLGGPSGLLSLANLSQPLMGAIAMYFFVNSGLMAGAIALSTRRSPWAIWHEKFLWSGPSVMVAGTAGAIAAIMFQRGTFWLALLMLAPVYLTYRTYHVFVGRIEDQQRHIEEEQRHHEETQRLHGEAIEALAVARRAERALADEKEHLSITLRSIGDGVITTDLQGIIVLINRAAETLTGWTREEAARRPLAMIFRNVDRQTRERCDNSLARITGSPDGPGVTRYTVLVARDLTERPIEENAAALRDATGRTIGMVVVFRDVSDALRAQEERARADKHSSLSLLAGGIAHDFNNILTAIMGSVSMARARMPLTGPAAGALGAPNAAAALGCLGEAEKACNRARRLTWQLLTFSKGGVPVKKSIAIPRILEESARLALRGSNVSCDFQIASDSWSVHADEGQLMRVFDNVLINARQATSEGGAITLHVQNIVETNERCEYGLHVEPGPYVRVSIVDKGIGIPAENLCSVFDPYFSTKQNGRGLGLAAAYSIVKNHGGYLSVESKPGHGTTVHVNLPALLDREAEDVTESVERKPGVSPTGRILVMDDEESIRTLAVNMLELLGYDAEAVSNGDAAVERYKHALRAGRPFDTVILDYAVPDGMGGDEAITRLATIDAAVNAILISGYAQDPVMTEFRERGFKAVIAKPFTLEDLSRTLGSVISPRNSTVH